MYGASGTYNKELVFKNYVYGTVVSKYPDMSKVKHTRKQKAVHETWTLAVAYAKSIINDPVKKKAYQKKIKKGRQVYNAAIQEYFRNVKKAAKSSVSDTV